MNAQAYICPHCGQDNGPDEDEPHDPREDGFVVYKCVRCYRIVAQGEEKTGEGAE